MYPDAKAAGEHYNDLLKVKERLDKDPNCNTYRMGIIDASIKKLKKEKEVIRKEVDHFK